MLRTALHTSDYLPGVHLLDPYSRTDECIIHLNEEAALKVSSYIITWGQKRQWVPRWDLLLSCRNDVGKTKSWNRTNFSFASSCTQKRVSSLFILPSLKKYLSWYLWKPHSHARNPADPSWLGMQSQGWAGQGRVQSEWWAVLVLHVCVCVCACVYWYCISTASQRKYTHTYTRRGIVITRQL